MTRTWRGLQGMLAVVILTIAALVLWRQVRAISSTQLHAAWAHTPIRAIAWCVACTAASLGCLALYEWFATRCVAPGRVPALSALRIGALSHAIANTLGFHAITGVALRTWFYKPFALDFREVAGVVATIALCVGSGVLLVLATALVQVSPDAGDAQTIVMPVAIALITGALGWAVWRRRHAQGDARIPATLAVTMLLVSWIEMACAIAALRVLLPASVAIDWAPFVLLFVGAMLIGLLSHVPGSVGVFEAAILSGLPQADPAAVLLALLAYRLIYNLLPFVLALCVLAIEFVRTRANRPPSVRRRV